MKKNNFIWIFAALLLFSVAAILAFLPRNAKTGGGETALNAAGNAGERLTDSETDCDRELAEAVFGKLVQTTDEEKARIEAELQEIGKLCRTYYLQAERVPSPYDDRENVSRRDIDAMEAALSSAGYCVANSDAVYPEFLENAESLTRFWDEVTQDRNAETTVWGISPSGSVYCRVFQYADGKDYCIHASSDWNDAGSLCLSYLNKKEILYWDMTASGFICQDAYPDRHWNAAELLRLRPVDHDLYAWTEKYIAPIGYHNVNLFLLDWDGNDFGRVCFNDLLSGMYRMEYGDYLYARDYPYSGEPYFHSVIPASLFESVIYAHFRIPMEEFRERALYDAENDAYPWQDLSCENILYYPELIPEVTKVTENADGTVTLLVNVICPDKHTDHLFEHAVTMNIEPDGAFQFLSNRIVYRGTAELPSPQARIEVQRFAV